MRRRRCLRRPEHDRERGAPERVHRAVVEGPREADREARRDEGENRRRRDRKKCAQPVHALPLIGYQPC